MTLNDRAVSAIAPLPILGRSEIEKIPSHIHLGAYPESTKTSIQPSCYRHQLLIALTGNLIPLDDGSRTLGAKYQ